MAPVTPVFGPGLWREPGDPEEAAEETRSRACWGLQGPGRGWDSCVLSESVPEAIPLPLSRPRNHPHPRNPSLRAERSDLRPSGVPRGPRTGRACLICCLSPEGSRRPSEVVRTSALRYLTFAGYFFLPDNSSRLTVSQVLLIPTPAYRCGFFLSLTRPSRQGHLGRSVLPSPGAVRAAQQNPGTQTPRSAVFGDPQAG